MGRSLMLDSNVGAFALAGFVFSGAFVAVGLVSTRVVA